MRQFRPVCVSPPSGAFKTRRRTTKMSAGSCPARYNCRRRASAPPGSAGIPRTRSLRRSA